MEEIWKDIKEFNGNYQISNFGRVKSVPRISGNPPRKIRGGILKPVLNHYGYLCVCLGMNSKWTNREIHRLVGEYFVNGKSAEKYHVNHKDENKTNNHFTNLEWCTPAYNKQYSSKLNMEIAEKIRKEYKDGVSQYQLAQKYNTIQATVSRIILNKSWVQTEF